MAERERHGIRLTTKSGGAYLVGADGYLLKGDRRTWRFKLLWNKDRSASMDFDRVVRVLNQDLAGCTKSTCNYTVEFVGAEGEEHVIKNIKIVSLFCEYDAKAEAAAAKTKRINADRASDLTKAFAYIERVLG